MTRMIVSIPAIDSITRLVDSLCLQYTLTDVSIKFREVSGMLHASVGIVKQ